MVNEVRLVVSVLCFVSRFEGLNHRENGKMNGVATFLTLMTLQLMTADAGPIALYTLITAALVFTDACPTTFYTLITAALVLTLVVLSVLLALHTGLAADTFDDFKLTFCSTAFASFAVEILNWGCFHYASMLRCLKMGFLEPPWL